MQAGDVAVQAGGVAVQAGVADLQSQRVALLPQILVTFVHSFVYSVVKKLVMTLFEHATTFCILADIRTTCPLLFLLSVAPSLPPRRKSFMDWGPL